MPASPNLVKAGPREKASAGVSRWPATSVARAGHEVDPVDMNGMLKYRGHCGAAFVSPSSTPATCTQCGRTTRAFRMDETGWGCGKCDAGGGPPEQRFCYNCGFDSRAKPETHSLEQGTRLCCRSASRTCSSSRCSNYAGHSTRGIDPAAPSLDQLDKYSRDSFPHEHPETGEKHTFEFWCPKTLLQYAIGDMGRSPRCTVFEHQLRED